MEFWIPREPPRPWLDPDDDRSVGVTRAVIIVISRRLSRSRCAVIHVTTYTPSSLLCACATSYPKIGAAILLLVDWHGKRGRGDSHRGTYISPEKKSTRPKKKRTEEPRTSSYTRAELHSACKFFGARRIRVRSELLRESSDAR